MKSHLRRACLSLVLLSAVGRNAGAGSALARYARFATVEYPFATPSSRVLCPKTESAPVIDGDFGDPAWREALVARDFYLLGDGRKVRASVRTVVRFMYDAGHLYVGAKCWDAHSPDLPVPRKSTEHDKGVSFGNAIELFFDVNGDRRSYYQVAFDLAGNIWDARFEANGKIDTDWTCHAVRKVRRFDGFWTIEAMLPLKDFGVEGSLDSQAWGVNVGRDQTGIPGEANSAWCGTYHNPRLYQQVLFAPRGGAYVTRLTYGERVWGRNAVRGRIENPGGEPREVLARIAWREENGARRTIRSRRIALPARGRAEFVLPYEVPFSWLGRMTEKSERRLLTLSLQEVNTGKFVRVSSAWIAPPPPITLRMDRVRYHFNDLDGQAVMRINVSRDLLPEARVRLALYRTGAQAKAIQTQTLAALSRREVVFCVPLERLAPGPYRFSATLVVKERDIATTEVRFRKAQGEPREAKRGRIPLIIQPAPTPDGRWPVTMGVPFPNGALRRAGNVRLLDRNGREIPLQARVTARWTPHGFVKWLLLDFIARVNAERPTTWQLEYGTDVHRRPTSSPLKVRETTDAITVTTGPLRFTVRKDRFRFLDAAWLDANHDGRFEAAEQVVRTDSASGAYFVDHEGVRYDSGAVGPDSVEVEEVGPRRVVLRATGWQVAADGKRRLGRYVTRMYAYAGQPFLRVFHTFIITADSRKVRYRDIALETAPVRVSRCAVGTERGGTVGSEGGISLVQDGWNHFLVRGVGRRVEGRHAPGWIRADGPEVGVTVAVRDFWQNYPKELEVADGRLIVHFWPAHNTPRKHTLANTTRFNVHMLWFAHEGKELNFSIPPEYLKKFNRKSPFESCYYVPSGVRNANAMGVGKTHEMLFFFHPSTASPERVRAMVNAFQHGVAVMAAPGWVCSSEAFGCMPMQPRDPERFPTIEWGVSAMFDCERRLERYTHDYGMWVFGDGHNAWNAADKRWYIHRVWRGMHHGSPRVPWLLYARSGDPKYLTYARRNTRHCMDVYICHYSTPEFEGLSYPRQKIRGALCDYKGLVPWHAGGRLFDYNCMADFLLYNYYVTGDRRGLDVLNEWIEAAVKRFGKTHAGRNGAGPLATCLAAYQHTWDYRLLRLIDQFARAMIGSQQPDGSIGGWAEYAPWLNRLHKFTGSPESERCLEKWCDWYVRNLSVATKYQPRKHLWPVAYGYHVFRRPEYLACQTGFLRIAFESVYHKPGDLYDGYWTSGVSYEAGYLLQELPFYLYALSEYGKPLKPRYYGRQSFELGPGKYRIVALDKEDRAFRFHWTGGVREKPVRYTFTAPDGAVIRRGALQPGKDADLSIEVPADGKKGEYVMTFEVGRYLSFTMPLSDLPGEVLDTEYRPVVLIRQPRAIFFVPENCTGATMHVSQYLEPNVVCVFDGADHLAARVQWLGTEQRNGVDIALRPRSDQRGQLWDMHFGYKSKRSVLTLRKPLPPYISITRERFFLPHAR